MIDIFCLQVRPHVEGDLLRVWKDTESWQARLKAEDEGSINRPLFDVNSFTSHQVRQRHCILQTQPLGINGCVQALYWFKHGFFISNVLRICSDGVALNSIAREQHVQHIHKPAGLRCFKQEIIHLCCFQVTADPRFRLEERLREAGLQDSRFAREAMAKMKPLRTPRRDLESTVFQWT